MNQHFEELWEKCEEFHKTSGDTGSATESDISELMMKLNLYKAMCQKEDLPADSAGKIKTRAMGEILLLLTKISLKDNINTFAALQEALEYKSIETFSQKY